MVGQDGCKSSAQNDRKELVRTVGNQADKVEGHVFLNQGKDKNSRLPSKERTFQRPSV